MLVVCSHMQQCVCDGMYLLTNKPDIRPCFVCDYHSDKLELDSQFSEPETEDSETLAIYVSLGFIST